MDTNKNTVYSKKENKIKRILAISLVLNLLLLASVYYIGIVKTNFYERTKVWMGIGERTPVLPGDFYCLSGWTNTLRQLNYDADIVFYGNSITTGGNFQKYFPDVKICNLGYPGDDLYGMPIRANQIKYLKPEKVFVMGGINRLQEMSDEDFEQKYQCLVDSIKKAVPNAKIYLQSILPINHRMTKAYASSKKIIKSNETIKAISERSGCFYVDLYSVYEENGEMPSELTEDGIHLYDEAYSIWAEAIRQYIE
jgi:lysophospholipase L1-like esterase